MEHLPLVNTDFVKIQNENSIEKSLIVYSLHFILSKSRFSFFD